MTNPNLCSCGGTYGADGICPDCGNIKPASGAAVAVAADSVSSGRNGSTSSKSSKARAAAISVKSHVTARPNTVATLSGVVANGATTVRRRRADTSRSTTSKRNGIAAGLIDLAPLPPVEPQKLIRPNLGIPEEQRVCSNPDCKYAHEHNGTPRNLYRVREDKTSIDKGICPSCKTPFNFAPIAKDTVISGQYSVMGPMAVGGFGFIYLAWDLNVGRYVVLKGLLNSKDPEAQANAVQERRFLADLMDPHIVNIVNFVTYEDPDSGDKQTFIVMEFIDGQTLKQLKKKWMQENNNQPLPLTEAIYYTLGILPAFSYLHKQGVIYCDYKMDNAMYQGNRLRLIDMGGAHRTKDSTDSGVFFTHGYVAPEACIKGAQVTPASDLFTIGRTLAIMALNFEWVGDFNDKDEYVPGPHDFDFPTPDEEPLFAKYESFYRFLLRACHADPDQRFQSAEEMADQLLGVLGEIVSIDSEQPRPPITSTEFSMDVLKEEERPSFRSIQELAIDRTDPAMSLIEAGLALNDPQEQAQLYAQAIAQYPKSKEAPLRLATVLTDLRRYDQAKAIIAKAEEADPFDFRNVWVMGRLLLAQGQIDDAIKHFDAVYSEVPGELAPKQALAIACELKGDLDTAIRYYELVSSIDRSYTTSAFGLARCLRSRDVAAAVDAFERVSPMSISYVPALMAKVRTILSGNPDGQGFTLASQTLAKLTADNLATHKLRADVFIAAIQQLKAGRVTKGGDQILGAALDDAALRDAAEKELRECARYAGSETERFALVDQANSVRRITNF